MDQLDLFGATAYSSRSSMERTYYRHHPPQADTIECDKCDGTGFVDVGSTGAHDLVVGEPVVVVSTGYAGLCGVVTALPYGPDPRVWVRLVGDSWDLGFAASALAPGVVQ